MYDLIEIDPALSDGRRTLQSFSSPYDAVEIIRQRHLAGDRRALTWRVLDLDGVELFGPDDLYAIVEAAAESFAF